jgi:hypothetical protein
MGFLHSSALGAGVSFFLRHAGLLKYSPDQPRDEHGRWTTGEGPNTGHLNIRTAFNALSSQRHKAMVLAGRDWAGTSNRQPFGRP